MKIGNFNISNLKLGIVQIKKVFSGLDLVWTSFLSIINDFKARVLGNQGQFEGETCLNNTLEDIGIDLFEQASLVVTPNGYKENVLYSVTPSPVGTNLFLNSEAFDNGSWFKVGGTITADDAIAPDGTITADLFTKTGAINTTTGVARSPNAYSTAGIHTLSIYIKPKIGNTVLLRMDRGGNTTNFLFNFTTKTFTNTGANVISSSYEELPDGWFRIICTSNVLLSTWAIEVCGLFANPTGDAMWIWGAQLEEGATAGNYIQTTYRQVINETVCDFNVVRATTATRINVDGLMEPVPYNLFSYSEEFNNTYWNKTNQTITSNQAIAPDGNMTADLYVPNTVFAEHFFNPIITTSNSGVFLNTSNTYNWSIYAKPAGNNFFILRTNIGGTWSAVVFNLSTQTIQSISPNFISADIEDAGNGWSLISCVFTNNSSYQHISTPTGAIAFSGDGVSGAYIWGAQLTLGATKRDYFPTTNRLNVPRLDYGNGSCPSILAEPQMTNSWTNNNITTGYTTNTNAIKGATISNAFGEGFAGFEYNFIGGVDFISSLNSIRVFDTRNLPIQRLCLYIKNPSSDFFGINFLNVGEVIFKFSTLEVSNSTLGSIKKINNDTYALYIYTDNATMGQFSQVRVAFVTSLTSDTNVDGSAILGLAYYQGAATGTVGLQNYNYIPIITSTAAITRNADYINNTNGFDLIGQTEGTIFLDFDRTLVFAGIKALLTLYSVINDETFHIQTGSNQYTTISVSIVSVSNGVSVVRGMDLLEGRNKLAVVYSTSGTKIFLNGTQLTPLTNTALPSMSVINLSNRTGQRIYGPIRQFVLWKTQIADEQAINLTTL